MDIHEYLGIYQFQIPWITKYIHGWFPINIQEYSGTLNGPFHIHGYPWIQAGQMKILAPWIFMKIHKCIGPLNTMNVLGLKFPGYSWIFMDKSFRHYELPLLLLLVLVLLLLLLLLLLILLLGYCCTTTTT